MSADPHHAFAGVLFDLDGVLIDSTESILALWRDLAAGYGRTLAGSTLRDHVLGCSPEHSVAALFGDLDDDARRDLLDRVRAAETHLGFVEVPGARQLVGALGAAGVRLGLVTGASAARARRALALLGAGTLFETSVTWGETERGKPAPDCYRLAAARLGLPPHRCLVIEDAPSGVLAASAAGAATVGVGDEVSLRAAGARWTVPDLTVLGCAPVPAGVALDLPGGPVPVSVPVAPSGGRDER